MPLATVSVHCCDEMQQPVTGTQAHSICRRHMWLPGSYGPFASRQKIRYIWLPALDWMQVTCIQYPAIVRRTEMRLTTIRYSFPRRCKPLLNSGAPTQFPETSSTSKTVIGDNHIEFLVFFSTPSILCSPSCPGICSVKQAGLKLSNLPISASLVGLKTCATMYSINGTIYMYNHEEE